MIKANFDGSKKGGKDGIATYGCVIYKNDKMLYSGNGVVGIGEKYTNNIAEYHALLELSEYIPLYASLRDSIIIRGDSKLVINQVMGKWKINKDEFHYYVENIRKNLEGFSVVYVWIPREENEVADRLAMEAYNSYLMDKMKKRV